jgi:hypothetical protein
MKQIIQCKDGVRFTFRTITDVDCIQGFLIVTLENRDIYKIAVSNIVWML